MVDNLSEAGILKEEITKTMTNSTGIEKPTKIISRTSSWSLNPTHLKKKNYFKRKPIKQRNLKIKPSLTKHQIKLLKDANTLIADNNGTNFLFAYADIHTNLKICLKDARNGWEVVRFANEKDFNNLFPKCF